MIKEVYRLLLGINPKTDDGNTFVTKLLAALAKLVNYKHRLQMSIPTKAPTRSQKTKRRTKK